MRSGTAENDRMPFAPSANSLRSGYFELPAKRGVALVDDADLPEPDP